MDSETITKKRNTKIIVSLATLIFLSIIGYSAYVLISRIGKVGVNVQYAPYIAKVVIDGNKTLKNNAVNYLEPGDHTIEASYEGFNTFQENITITNNTINIYGILNPNSPEGEQLAEKYQNDFLAVQSIYGQESINRGEQQREEWPLLNSLPITNILYSIGYILDNNNLTITVRTTLPYLDSVLEDLINLAEAPKTIATYNIQINDFTNLLANSFTENTNTDPLQYLETGYNNISDITINPGNYNNNYYYTTISTGSTEDYTLVTYRIVLQKNNSSWQFAGTPYPIATTTNTPNTPLDILNAVNNISTNTY